MTKITRLTFTDGSKMEELDFSGEAVLTINDTARICIESAAFPKNDVRDWMVIASNEKGLQYSGEVLDVFEEVAMTGVMVTFDCLPAAKQTQPGPRNFP